MIDDVNLIGESKTITIGPDADWDQPFWLVDGTRPFDLTDCTVELWIRPTFDHDTLIRTLSSDVAADDGGGEIIITDEIKGACQILVPAATITSAIGVSPKQGWSQFLRVITVSGTIIEWWRGPLHVLAGKVTS